MYNLISNSCYYGVNYIDIGKVIGKIISCYNEGQLV